MKVQIKAKGRLFDAEPPLEAVIDLLRSYQVGFGECIKIASGAHGVQAGALHPRIRLQSVTRGSLDVWTVLGAASSIQAVALPILRDAWTLYKEAKELISLFSRFFDRNQRAMQTVIHNEFQVQPGASFYLIQNSVVHVTPELHQAAKKARPGLESAASLVSSRQAGHVDFTPEAPDLEGFRIDESNQDDFKGRSHTIESDETLQMDANIVQFHKQTMNGKLEIFDAGEGHSRTVPFSIREGDADDYIQAMRAPACRITAFKEFRENALGETSILRLHLVEATPAQ